MPCGLSRLFTASAVVAVTTFGALAQGQDALLLQQARALFKKLPTNFADAQHPITPERVALGKALFFDPRWSVDRNVSCATCHHPALYGTDALSKSIGVKGKQLPRNAPTVLKWQGMFQRTGEVSARASKIRQSRPPSVSSAQVIPTMPRGSRNSRPSTATSRCSSGRFQTTRSP